MRRRAFVSLFLAAFVGSTFETDLGAAQAQDAREFVAISGVPTMIYGERNECAKDVAPSYEAVLEANAVTRPPEHGALSGGGVEERYSKRCDRRVPVRAIMYTSDPGYTGTDSVTFWGREMVIINVVPAATAQTPSSTVPNAAGAVLDQAPARLDDGWAVAAPSEAGFDPAALAALTADIENNKIRNVHAVIVEHAGRLVYEQYFSGLDERWGRSIGDISFDHDSLHDLRSVTKSVTTALLGIALGDDYQAAIERPIIEYFEDLEGKFGAGVEDITLRHVLTMTAGLEWNERGVPYTENDELRMNDAPDPISMVLGRPVRDPVGSRWNYNGGLTQLLAGLIHRMTGKQIDKFAEKTLFGPLGITSYEWLGSPAWSPEKFPSAASGLRMRARDLAKFGSLFLHKGVWKGQQIIPAEWVKLSTRRHVQNIPLSLDGNIGYGFMWYAGRITGNDGYHFIGAAGKGDQHIFIVPEKEIVVTLYAGNYKNSGQRSGTKVLAKVMGALLSGNNVRGIGGDSRWMDVPQGQLKTKIYGIGSHSENPVLVVVLHGDGVSGRPRPSSQYAIAQAIAEGFESEGLRHLRFDDVVAAGILRPGYTDPDGDQSDGRMGTRTGDNHTREVTEAVVAVVNTLKKELNARAVILMGHSGGATISANILALYPDTADAALLVACGCDMAAARARYYDRTGDPAWSTPTASLDPMTSAHEVPVGKKVRLVVGENDDITSPEDIRRYADVLAANGVDVEMVVAPGQGHNSILIAPVVFNNLDELVRAY